MAADADAVLLTCSTLGPVVDALNAKSHVPILRADAALAVAAAAHHGKVAVLCAAATTVPATRTLFEHAASGSDAQIELTLVPNAWRCFKSGDSEGYQSLLVGAIERAYVDGASIVVLAQASMAPAAARCRLTPVPLTVPASALAAILAFLESPMTDSEYDVNQ
nr:aspartate/glutamate racemase family protein [Robbsia betulipollinis]